MPLEPSERIAFRRPSHELKSPTTLIARAAGAHTANAVPVTVWVGSNLAHVRAELLVELLVAALADQMEVQLTDRRRERVRILDRERPGRAVADLEPIVQRQPGALDDALEHSARVDPLELESGAVVELGRDLGGARAQDTDRHTVTLGMGAQYRVRVRVLAPDQGVELVGGDGHDSSSSRLIPATGIGTQSGRLSSSYWSS